MIHLHNGQHIDFLCASGALGFDGRGYLWEKPLIYFNIIRPHELTIITKTLTLEPRPGNLRWWSPWKCFRFIPNGTVNCVGLSNPGLGWWLRRFPSFPKYKYVVSIAPASVREALLMTSDLNELPLVGVEFNASCPNTEDWSADKVCAITLAVAIGSKHPVFVKLGYTQNYIQICEQLDGSVAAFDLINSVPWSAVFPDQASPLEPAGGVSGAVIQARAKDALWKIKTVTTKTPIISGGGIDSEREVITRRCMGAQAWTFGTIFLRRPWLPNQIASSCRKLWRSNNS